MVFDLCGDVALLKAKVNRAGQQMRRASESRHLYHLAWLPSAGRLTTLCCVVALVYSKQPPGVAARHEGGVATDVQLLACKMGYTLTCSAIGRLDCKASMIAYNGRLNVVPTFQHPWKPSTQTSEHRLSCILEVWTGFACVNSNSRCVAAGCNQCSRTSKSRNM